MASSVNVIASPTTGPVEAVADNPAIQLAQSLQDATPKVTQALGDFATRQSKIVGDQANLDAMANSGEAFADAVRDGKIEPTQNPWYVRQYETQAATVRGQQDVSSIVADSQTWAERNDPGAYQARLNAEIGKVGQDNYGSSPFQIAGFKAAADPMVQQATAANTAYNVQRINQEHTQNLSALATQSVISTSAAAGGHPTAEQVTQALEPAHQSWLSTGGTEADWNMIHVNSMVAAAANSNNAALLDAIPPELANIAGPDGKPIAIELQQQRYRIQQASEAMGMGEIRANQNAQKLAGMQAMTQLQATFGYDLLQGKVSKQTIMETLQANHVDPQAAAYAIAQLSEQATQSNALGRALTGANAPAILDLYTRANRDGYSPGLDADVSEAVRTGQMELPEAQGIISAATSRQNHLESEQRSDERSAKSDARAAAADSRRLTLDMAKDLKDNRAQSGGLVSTKLQQMGDKSLLNSTQRTRIDKGASDAEGAWLKTHSGDLQGAMKAADDYYNQYLVTRIQQRKGTATPTTQNTRR